MKSKLYLGIISNLLTLVILNNTGDRAYAKQKPAANKLPATTVGQWQSQLNRSVTVITEIELQETRSGIEIIVTTADGKRLRRRESTEGNNLNLIINFVNAKLQLAESSFVRQNPIAGISEVRAIALEGNRVRIIVSGVETTPTGEVINTPQGAIISVTPPAPVAPTPAPDRVIDIVVTAEKRPEPIRPRLYLQFGFAISFSCGYFYQTRITRIWDELF